ncbi:cytochrome c oxidase assembly factor CtaG [Virgibacillus sp. C22-A2]|uniref:Cytochrome c oxidase assembly factor CtaG n=1 Tax=Virgibacillus tibetensis TaxID=3042313 RepID=A0ABU6KDB4_9BACI|nr:cytochrome c oxidase assembly factor CtaG [Virgibacillus sp. C22-A2]
MWLELQIFGFRALWSPYFFMFVLFLALLYFLITGPYRRKFGENDKPSFSQQIFFYTALLLLYLVKGSPVDLLSHIMLSAHMVQMAIYYLIFPIFIIKGLPVWVWRKVIEKPVIKPVLKLLTKPIISLLLFNTLFSLYHVPAVFDFAKSSQLIHTSISLTILFAAFIVWWPILSPIKEYDTMSPVLKLGYIFANGVLITPACVLIIFADHALFATYSQDGAWMQALALCVPGDVLQGITYSISGPEMFSPFSTMEDQQLGGIIMKIMQEITYGVILGRVFFKWFNKKSLEIDPIPVTETQTQS